MRSRIKLAISAVACVAVIILIGEHKPEFSSEVLQEAHDRISAYPEDMQSRERFIELLLQEYRTYLDGALLEKAEIEIANGLDQDAKNSKLYFYSATIELSKHHFANALELADISIELRPKSAAFYGPKVDALVELGRYEEAVQTLQTMVDLRPDFASFSRVSYVRELYGDIDGAKEALESALDAAGIAEHRAWALTHLGHLYLESDTLHADRLYDQALSIVEDYPPALAGKSHVAVKQNNLHDAEHYLLDAFTLSPLPDYSSLLAKLYQSNNNQKLFEEYTSLTIRGFKQATTAGYDVDLEHAAFLLSIDQNPTQALTLALQAYEHRPSITAAKVLADAYIANGDEESASSLRTTLTL